MPRGVFETSRFSKVSSIFGRDAFATMRYVTLLNVSKIRDISNDERKVPFKNDEYLASGTSQAFLQACIHQRLNKIRNHYKNIAFCGNYLSSRLTEQFSLSAAKYPIYCRHNKQSVVRTITSGMGSLRDLLIF